MKAADNLTHIDNAEDKPFLRTPLLDVNMRLFHNNIYYKNWVLIACAHIGNLAVTEFDDYKKPHGMSGANCGIPLNIIAIVENRGLDNETVRTLINPVITARGDGTSTLLSNCGSIRLKEPIEVKRDNTILVNYYDALGKFHENIMFGPSTGSFTIQHEVDHNKGILIIDRNKSENATY